MVETVPEIRGRVLVLDENPARSAHRCGQLTSAGWQMCQAGDVQEALSLVHEGDLDLALLQVSADEAEAMDLPRVLRLSSRTPYLPVVVLAPRPSEGIRCRFLDSGADDVVAEDISVAELAARLRALLRVKVLQDELQASRQALGDSLSRERALLAQLRRDNAHLLTLCTTDPLTHLQNVRRFDDFLESEFKIARRYGRKLSVLTFDLDHFKLINDTYGHPSGDFVLKEFAVILKQCVRDSDVVARTGGEEFSIVLPDASRAQARRFAQRIRKTVAGREFRVYGRSIHVTTSVGSATYPQDAEITEPHMLVYFADQALLLAKQNGRDRVLSFHELDPSARARMRREYPTTNQSSCEAPTDSAEPVDARR